MIFTRSFLPVAGTLALLWLLAFLATGIGGNYPYMDDWSFGKIAFQLAAGEGYKPDWVAMTLIAHAMAGALVAKVFGPDFVPLHIYGAVFGLAGAGVVLHGVRRLGLPPGDAFLVAATVLANPLYFVLAHTFQTDVPFVVVQGLQFYLLAAFLAGRGSSRLTLALVTLVTLWATLIRDIGIVMPAALILTLAVDKRWREAARMLLPFLAGVAALVIYRRWLGGLGLDLSHQEFWQRAFVHGLTRRSLLDYAATAYEPVLYAGLFLLPVAIPCACRQLARAGARERLAFLAVAAFAAMSMEAAAIALDNPFPPSAGLIDGYGFVGSPALTDVIIRQVSDVPVTPRWIFDVLHFWAVAGCGLLAACFFRIFSGGDAGSRRLALFSLLGVAGCNVGPVILGSHDDRYVLTSLIPLATALLRAPSRIAAEGVPAPWQGLSRGAAAALLLFFGAWSVAGGHDYVAWNQARWKILAYLTDSQKIAPAAIDGGFEFNGYYSDRAPIPFIHIVDMAEREKAMHDETRFLWRENPLYALTYGSRFDGYYPIISHPYSRWMPGRSDWFIFAHRRNGS